MAGTLIGIPLQQNIDLNGLPQSGAQLRLYLANTTTAATAYRDYGLTVGQEHPFPIVADALGRIPMFWLADGAYRARLTDSYGSVVYDIPYAQTVGNADTGGGETPVTVVTWQTGDVDWQPRAGTRDGWVRHNTGTLGNASSGATERANEDCRPLYEYLWNTYSNALCPVAGGRGGSAAADWAANKTIATLDLRGRAPFGLDDMGAAAANRFSGTTFATGNATTAASYGGVDTTTLVTANLPAYTPSGTVALGGEATFTGYVRAGDSGTATGNLTTGTNFSVQDLTVSSASFTAAFTGAAQGGTSTPLQRMPPFALGTWYVRL